MAADFNIVVKKVEAFRRKYLALNIFRGFLVFFVLLIVILLIINTIEYFLFLSVTWRRLLFISTSVFLILIFGFKVFYPFLRFFGIFGRISLDKTAWIIKEFVPEVKDKLVNVFELKNEMERNYSNDIILAAIDQKSKEISLLDYSGAVNWKNFQKIVYYALFSFLFALLIVFIDKSFFTEPVNRIVHFNQEFVKPLPYVFELKSENLEVEKGKSFNLVVAVNGKNLPSFLYVNIGGHNYLMKDIGNNAFEYHMNSVVNSIEFYFTDLKYKSLNYTLSVLNLPVVNDYIVEITPPAYTLNPGKSYQNIGDIQINSGGLIKWNFVCIDTDSLILRFDDGFEIQALGNGKGKFEAERKIKEKLKYKVLVRNKWFDYKLVMENRIDVIDDLFPEISVKGIADSLILTRIYFVGRITDDFGFTGLSFNMNFSDGDTVLPVDFARNQIDQRFIYSVDFKEFKSFGDRIDYYFTVIDNDVVNGFKSTTSESFHFLFPSSIDLKEKREQGFDQIEKLMEESKMLANKIENDIQELKIKNINENVTDWEKSEMVRQILENKEYLEEKLQKINDLYKEGNAFQNTFGENSSDILEKQKQIEELLENVLTDELKKLLEEFNDLAKEFNSNKFNELKQRMDLSMDDLSKQLDKNLEILQRMRVEQEFNEVIKDVKKVNESQSVLREIIAEKDFNEELIRKLQYDKEEIDSIKERLNTVLDENDKLKRPLLFDSFDEEFSRISESIENTLTEVKRKNRRNSLRNINSTIENLEQLLFSMEQMLKNNKKKQNMENVRNLQQILKNLLVLSFDQEEILNQSMRLSLSDPIFNLLKRRQNILIGQSQTIKDSLYALAARVPQLGTVVNNELLSLEMNMSRSLEQMNEGQLGMAVTNHQFSITALNNLAVMLSDILDQINEKMENAEDGDGDPQDGSNSKKMSNFRKQGEDLKEQLQRMIEQMKDGKSPGSRQLSESLMMHEMMQQMLRQLINSGGLSEDSRKQLQQIDRILEENRREIMNKQISPLLLQRNNEILSRLLEAEKAEIERDQDNKRESNTANEMFYSKPASFFEELMPKNNNTFEHLQRNDLKLNNFYQKKLRNYLNTIEEYAPE